MSRFKAVGVIAQANPGGRQPESRIRALERVRSLPTILPRKTSWGVVIVTVPQTDTGRWAENAKARERTIVKELGKIVP